MTSEAGLTFVEVLVAALLIGIALVPLMQLYPQILEADQVVEESTIVGIAAARKMDELIARLRDDIGSVGAGAAACGDLPSCRVEWTVSTDDSSGDPGVGSLQAITVTACVDADASATCDAREHPVRYDAKITSRP